MFTEKRKLRNMTARCHITPLALFMVCLAGSCANIQEVSEDNDKVSTENSTFKVLNYDSDNDSLKVRNFMQSDIDVILLNHISIKDGVYTFPLTQDEALSLGASEDKYQYYKSIVDNLNETK